MAGKLRIFVSSVQKELQAERRAIKDHVLSDPLLSKFFGDVFLFEDLPARDRRADETYLEQAGGREVFIGILGSRYGAAGVDGFSPIESEFRRATAARAERLLFVKDEAEGTPREPEMSAFIERATADLRRRRFRDVEALRREVNASLVDYLEETGRLQIKPFDSSSPDDASLRDIDPRRISAFVDAAEAANRLAPGGARAPREVLLHLDLLHGRRLTNAAVLLFGRHPERFGDQTRLQCLHFAGVEKGKPIESQQLFQGTLFELIDRAGEWLRDRLARRVGRLGESGKAPVEFEIPAGVFNEAIVNAVAHRDYRRRGFVQVELYADRVEIASPGRLPPDLTPDDLRKPHGPVHWNPLIADALFRANYCQRAGTGTTDMIRDSVAAGLPEPSFVQRGPEFVVTLWRDLLTSELLAGLALNERQRAAIPYLKSVARLKSAQYQRLTGASRQTASRDLDDLVEKGVLDRVGRGRGTYYARARRMPRK